jgi:CheY-like chemotaxis protein
MKILISDSETTNNEFLKEIISSYLNDIGYSENIEIDTVYNGKDAYKKIKNNNYNIIFIENYLNDEMSGIEVTRLTRLLDIPQPMIIMISKINSEQNMKEAFFNGANWFILKPYKFEMIEVLLNDIIVEKGYLNLQNIEHKIQTAKEFMENFIYEINFERLEEINDDILKYLNKFAQTKDKKYLLEISYQFLKYCDYLEKTPEYEKLKYGFLQIAELLKKPVPNFNEEFFIDFLYGLIQDLQKWSQNIFIEKNAINIHYLDDSLITSISQLTSILSGNNKEEEEKELDIELF